MNSALHLLGIARKAGRLEVGEEPVAAAVRAGHARLVLVAGDAVKTASAGQAVLPAGAGFPGFKLLSISWSWAALWAAPPVPCWPSQILGWLRR